MSTNKIVPIISTMERNCLTMANWEELGVTHLAVDLYSLLMKPGLEVLKLIPDLKKYLGWRQQLTINAEQLVIKNGEIRITSIYDGRKFTVSLDAIRNLLNAWDIDGILWPQELEITQNLLACEKNIFENYDFIQTNTPAADAIQGLVYIGKIKVKLNDAALQNPFKVLDDSCTCPTCKAKLTAKYLEYLSISTPLLAQRYLIQHNITQAFTL